MRHTFGSGSINHGDAFEADFKGKLQIKRSKERNKQVGQESEAKDRLWPSVVQSMKAFSHQRTVYVI